MKISFSLNLYDKDGDKYQQCVLLFVGDEKVILNFKDLCELQEFAQQINGAVIPEIVENCFDELTEEDQAEFGD